MPYESLRDERERAGYTQQYMADQLGITRQTYASIERNPGKATVLQAKSISRLLAKNYEVLFFGEDASLINA